MPPEGCDVVETFTRKCSWSERGGDSCEDGDGTTRVTGGCGFIPNPCRVRLYTFADETKKRGKQKRQDNAKEEEAAPVQTLSPCSNAICQKRGDHIHNDTDDEKSTPAEAEVGDQAVKAETFPVQGVFAFFAPVL